MRLIRCIPVPWIHRTTRINRAVSVSGSTAGPISNVRHSSQLPRMRPGTISKASRSPGLLPSRPPGLSSPRLPGPSRLPGLFLPQALTAFPGTKKPAPMTQLAPASLPVWLVSRWLLRLRLRQAVALVLYVDGHLG